MEEEEEEEVGGLFLGRSCVVPSCDSEFRSCGTPWMKYMLWYWSQTRTASGIPPNVAAKTINKNKINKNKYKKIKKIKI